MRVIGYLTKNTEVVPFNYQDQLTSKLHAWLGQNNEFHNRISLYSTSWLRGINGRVKTLKDGFYFPLGATWTISFHGINIKQDLLRGITSGEEVCCGMKVCKVAIIDTNHYPKFHDNYRFILASPVLVKRNSEKTNLYYTYENAEADVFMTETLKRKLSFAGIPFKDEEVKVYFDREYNKKKIKKVIYRNIKNIASFCPVIVNAPPEIIAFVWEVGIGNSTGCGFGSVV